ncbi:MAG: hypothetical protein OER88_14210, partial [Planctomycetota bacterium]|nr:hypothetical protein [Planctomycetota bacterium]
EESWRPLGLPQTLESPDRAFAWGLETSPRWPLGAYRVRVVVRDANDEEIEFAVPVTLIAP